MYAIWRVCPSLGNLVVLQEHIAEIENKLVELNATRNTQKGDLEDQERSRSQLSTATAVERHPAVIFGHDDEPRCQ
jgi:hypothetical protein